MAHAERTVLINRPVESVYDFVLNGANNKLWRSSVLDVKPSTPAPYGVGSRFEQGLKGPTGRIAGDYEIVEAKPHELIRFQVTAGPARPNGTFRFAQKDAATEVTFILDYRPQAKQVTSSAVQQAAKMAGDDSSASAGLSEPEKRVAGMASQGKSDQQMSRSLSLGEGTVRNLLFSVQSKLMEPMIQRSMEQEVGMLDALKVFLEKHA
jgi:uncharacterized protein YndB with AHSA1/START domain